MAERKLFLQIQSINIVYPNVKNMIVLPITKRMKIIMSTQVWLNSRKNFDYKENGKKKAFVANPKHQCRVSQSGERDCKAKNKKKWRLLWVSKFVSFHERTLIIRKMVERKPFFEIQNINTVHPNMENMIVAPITKRMDFIVSIQV